MYPNNPAMDFDCSCPVKHRKNVWSDITGVHVRFCPMCNERREQFYEPTVRWEEIGRGMRGEPEPVQVRTERLAADSKRGTVRNPRI